MEIKNFTRIAFLVVLIALATSQVSALSLSALWENQQTTIEIPNGLSVGYAYLLSNDYGFSYTDMSVKIFDTTTGNTVFLDEIHYKRIYDQLYSSPTIYVHAEDYNYVPGNYFLDIKATEHINGQTIIRSEQLFLEVAGNRGPRVTYTYVPENPTTDDTVVFTADAQDDDGTIVQYEWFIDGVAQNNDNEVFSKQFASSGFYNVKVQVWDNEGAIAQYSEMIYVEQGTVNQPPNANFYWTPENPMIYSYVDFVSTSTDPENDPLTYYWTIDGQFVSNQETFTKFFPSSGQFEIKLKVTDSAGNSDTETKILNVGGITNTAPVAIIEYTPENPAPGETVYFDGSESYDVDGQIVSYEWTVDDSIVSNSVSFNYIFESEKSYRVELKVTDNEGAIGIANVYVDVRFANNPPVISPIPDQSVEENTFYQYQVQVSDPDNDPLNCYEVNIPNWLSLSGTNNCLISGTTPEVPFDYNFEVSVGVFDGQLSDEDSYVLTVLDTAGSNQPPVAEFTYSPQNPIAGETVTFDGSESYDVDGQIVSYEWRVDGVLVGTGQVIGYAFQSEDTYSVSLTVTDNDGATDTETKTIHVGGVPTLVLDELSCNANVVQGQQQHCSAHVQNDIEGATIKFRYSNSNELLGTCVTNFKGYCHINPVINKPVGYYEVYATAEKAGYNPDNTKFLRTTFRVWAERYIIENLQTWEDEFITENYTFYRANPVYSSFDVLDLFTGQYVPPGSGLVEHVFLRVNNQDPANFTPIGEFQLRRVASSHTEEKALTGLEPDGTAGDAGAYRFVLESIPITDDYLGEGKVFAFVLNFSDGTAGQDSVNVLILNNELVFEQPGPYYMKPGNSVTINFNDFLSDVETPDDEIEMSVGDYWPFTIENVGINRYKVTAPSNFEGEHDVLFTADDTDGSVVTRSVKFIVSENQTNIPPLASFYYEPLNPEVNEEVRFVSTSYDPDGNIISYRWTVDDVIVSEDSAFSYSFDSEGTYRVDLTVTDNDGATAHAYKYVEVGAGTGNINPVAGFEHSPLTPEAGQSVEFRSIAYDPDGFIALTEYSIDGITISGEPNFNFVFNEPGTYNVKQYVVDNEGASDSVVKTIVVRKPKVVGEPVAKLSVPGSTILGREVVLDGSDSYDPNGYIVSYNWKIINDGEVIETFQTTNPKVHYVFTERYANYVELTVVDNDGLTDTVQKRVDVGKARGGVNVGNGKDDGVYVDYFEVFGTDRGVISADEAYTVSVTVTNDRDEKLNNMHATFQIPEIGYVIKSQNFDIRAGDTEHMFIQDYLPFLPGDIEPGEYYALVGVAGDGVIRNKYYPLIIE